MFNRSRNTQPSITQHEQHNTNIKKRHPTVTLAGVIVESGDSYIVVKHASNGLTYTIHHDKTSLPIGFTGVFYCYIAPAGTKNYINLGSYYEISTIQDKQQF